MREPPSSGDSFADDYLPHLLVRAAQSAFAGFEAELRREGVKVPVWWVLVVLLEQTTETVTGLANRCALQQPTVSKLLDRMERQGLIYRAMDQHDHRIIRAALTAKGGVLASKLTEAAKHHEAALLDRHPQAKALKETLRAIAASRLY